jgi:hypothetical protein
MGASSDHNLPYLRNNKNNNSLSDYHMLGWQLPALWRNTVPPATEFILRLEASARCHNPAYHMNADFNENV